MKALSLWQPWASLWLSPAKLHETRHWSTSYRGQLAVHAAKTTKAYGNIPRDLELVVCRYFGKEWRQTLPTGALIGYVALIDCELTEGAAGIGRGYEWDDYICGDFSPGRWAWKRTPEYRRLETPVAYQGRQNLFTVSNELVYGPALAL